MNESCIFCRIVAGSTPATIVAHNEQALAFRDLHPKAPVHVLVIPRRHVTSLAEATDAAELGAMMVLAADVASAEGLVAGGYRVVTNIGADGGQTVPHLHLHVLGGRSMAWPPG
ncbi:histidine triad nucleotide-binding protein [Gemmatimonas phototrophica]|uniref:HIT family hydrolase n=1 Tax=Gemmatimonas phototrophica TaxID=1379270 RepID=A0A143BKS8_9BACT|nr:histidine triad nucleotide-binding protein [Gemmatimonas phototrophica]AMW05044.1 HIT family hydrolase [Gemmatimonas phototrophica]